MFAGFCRAKHWDDLQQAIVHPCTMPSADTVHGVMTVCSGLVGSEKDDWFIDMVMNLRCLPTTLFVPTIPSFT